MQRMGIPKAVSVLVIAGALAAAGLLWKQSRDAQEAINRNAFHEKEAARIKAAPRITVQWDMGNGETIRQIAVPGLFGALPTNCLIYTQADFHQSNMVCPPNLLDAGS